MTYGVFAENEDYLFLREEDEKIVYAIKKGSGAISMQSTKTAL